MIKRGKSAAGWTALLFVLVAAGAHSYDFGSLYHVFPTNISGGQLELKFQHRFFGSLADRPIDTFFGLREGANVLLGMRFAPIGHLHIATDYVFADAEPSLSIAWAIPTSVAVFSISGTGYSWLSGFSERRWGAMFHAAGETIPLFGVVVPGLGTWFKVEELEIGAYATIRATIPLSAGILESFVVVTEVFPNYTLRFRDGSGITQNSPWPGILVGFGVSTWGHNFIITLGNTFESGKRALTHGADGTGWYLGFALHRMISLFT